MSKKKMKSSKSVKNRFKVTGGGKVMHKRGGIKHRRSKETSSLRTRGKQEKELADPASKKIKKLLGVG